ncbi:MAG: DUF1844 domain-containing protein [Deltaproteobacteria bacterium]|nr:DUF1844 domain-containing protein [Deltaproteobacteria bacterium]
MFTDEGDVKHETVKGQEEKPSLEKEEVKQESAEKKEPKVEGGVREEAAPLPEINFATFLLSLHTSVLYHFGDFQDPATGETARNLPAAKQTIDILAMLKGKTTGNLDEDEQSLVDGILYELRMRYMKESEKK